MGVQNAGANSKLSPLPHEPAAFYGGSATVDIPLNSAAVKELINALLLKFLCLVSFTYLGSQFFSFNIRI